MANIEMSLDELISKQKGSGRGNRPRGRQPLAGRRRSGGISGGGGQRSGGGRFIFSSDVPAGKWKHDKFNEENDRGRNGGGRIGRGVGGFGGGRGGGVVQLNISNLPSTVVTSDLEELFQDFKVLGLSVHYDETGAHLGTADLFVDLQSANDIIREFRGIAIDNREMKFALVDESAAKTTIMDRIRRVRSNPIRDRRNGVRAGQRRSGGGGVRGKSGGEDTKGRQLNTDDLDKELDAYMSIRTKD